MKKKSLIPKWLIILDVIFVVTCFIPLIKMLSKKLIAVVVILNIIIIILRFIRNKKRQNLVSDVAEGVAVGVQQSSNPAVNSESVQKMDLFG